jgi:hypothetical protein
MLVRFTNFSFTSLRGKRTAAPSIAVMFVSPNRRASISVGGMFNSAQQQPRVLQRFFLKCFPSEGRRAGITLQILPRR